jgi:hypothetical protein
MEASGPPSSPEIDGRQRSGVVRAPGVPTEELGRAYALARRRMDAVPAPVTGYRLFWVHGERVGWTDLAASGGYAVIGAHEECDLVLAEDSALELRQLVAATIELSDGTALRLLDLHTQAPFHLLDGIPRRSVVVSGPVLLRLGRYVVGAVPTGADGNALGSADEVPTPIVTEVAAVPASMTPPGEPKTKGRLVSRVSALPPSRSILDIEGGKGTGGESESAQISLASENGSVSVGLTPGQLDAGVLIGRAPNCHGGGLRRLLDNSISRVHLLLLRHHDVVEAFDLCSTQGTYHEGRRARRIKLQGRSRLQLAAKHPVSLVWVPL